MVTVFLHESVSDFSDRWPSYSLRVAFCVINTVNNVS
jgi:hypothetical protein